MENLRTIIARHPFCSGLEPDYVDLLTSCASNVRFETDFRLFREGGEANQFYLIREGKVALEVLAARRACLSVETVAGGRGVGLVLAGSTLSLAFWCARSRTGPRHRGGWQMLTREMQKEPSAWLRTAQADS